MVIASPAWEQFLTASNGRKIEERSVLQVSQCVQGPQGILHGTRLPARCCASTRAEFAGSRGEEESGCTAQSGGSFWGGWRARVEELGCGDRGALELPCSQDSQLGKKEAGCIALCAGFLYVWPKSSLFDSEKSLSYTFLETRKEHTEAVLQSVHSVFLFPLSFDGDC